MNDVSPEILAEVEEYFDKAFYANEKIKRIYAKVRKGRASFAEMKNFAEMAGDILSEALEKAFSGGKLPDGKLYQNIAEKVITPMLQQNHSLVSEVCGYVMDDKNKAAKIGVKAVAAEFNAERAVTIAQIAANTGGVPKGSKAAQLITNMSLSFVDDFIRVNADLHKELGMVPKIQRIYHGGKETCEFCDERAYSGDYKGPDMPEGIFQRHRDCKCTLVYEPQKGIYQDPWSKKEAAEYERLVSDQRQYLTELDKMTPTERKLARNARARELRRSKYSAAEWSERKAMQARMQRIKEKESSLATGRKTVSKERQEKILLDAAKGRAAREARIIANVEAFEKKREAQRMLRKSIDNSGGGGIIISKKEAFQTRLLEHLDKDDFAKLFVDDPSTFTLFNPISLKRELERRGFEVRPLGRGRHKGQPFENGGGYIVNFGGNGAIEYHPAKQSRHGGRYYKVSDAVHGKRWFDINGNEIDITATGSGGRQILK